MRFVALGLIAASAVLLAPAATALADPSPDAVAAIDADYTAFGGAISLLGAPVGEAVDSPGGAVRDYEGGAIYYSRETGAHVMYGAILDRYRELGGPGGALGYPTNDEGDTGDGLGRFNDFSARGGASLVWAPDLGAWVITGRVLDAWRDTGGATGPFGYPIADTVVADGVQTGAFAGPGGTELRWSAADGLVTVPAELAATISGQAPAQGTPAPATSTTPTAAAEPSPPPAPDSAGTGKWWWVPASILAVVGLALLLWLIRLLFRGRSDEDVIEPGPDLADSVMSEPTTVIPAPPPAPVAGKSPPRERAMLPPLRAAPQYVAPRPPASERPRPPAAPAPPVSPAGVAPLADAPKAAGRTPPPAPPAKPSPPSPPSPPARPAPPRPRVTTDPTTDSAGPVIRYEAQPPAESAIRVTYENNAVGAHQESTADKSDKRAADDGGRI